MRDRVLHSILFFAIITVCASLLLKDVTLGDQEKIVRSIAEGGIDMFASLIAMFLGISLIWKDVGMLKGNPGTRVARLGYSRLG